MGCFLKRIVLLNWMVRGNTVSTMRAREGGKMPVDRKMLGDRIMNYRSKADISQETLAEETNQSRVNINRIENGSRLPSINVLVDIANTLQVSADDLLVDSLTYSSSTTDSELHRLLLECNKIEEQIITKNAQDLKKILYALGI